ncbi:hypothetical protein FANTH_14850 [Fusarium anthophilum]|uniref:Secreted lipase n=1 Tax=Fusarium anthophilum TaxID=48485 RepID=A0A8H4YFB7_9HYPO|nr:hypothetical protein FANTH_14850 [Fusarium anthophilum]
MPFLKTFLVFGFLTAYAKCQSSGQAGSFNVTQEIGDKFGCGSKCQTLINIANTADLAIIGTDFDYTFYNTAANFTLSRPGDLLKLKPMNASSLVNDYGTSVYRFQYTTRDQDESSLPSTGFIAFPFSVPKSGKFRPVVYAHSSIGVSRSCAPSNGPGLFECAVRGPLVALGYAIIATDFAGLGNNHTTHKFSNYVAHSEDFYYSMVAARAAFPGLFTQE